LAAHSAIGRHRPASSANFYNFSSSRIFSINFYKAGIPKSSVFCADRDRKQQSWMRSTCLYNNVCYNSGKGFLFFSNDTSPDQLTVASSPGSVIWPERAAPLNWVIVNGSRAIFEKNNTVWLKGLHAMYFSYNAENFGHFLGDELLPIFRAAMNFGLESVPLQMVKMQAKDVNQYPYTCDWMASQGMEQYSANCRRNYQNLPRLLSHLPLLELNTAFGDPNKLFCFHTMISGFGYLSDHCMDPTQHGHRPEGFREDGHICGHGVGPIFWAFRNHVLSRLNIKDIVPLESINVLISMGTSKNREYPGYDSLPNLLTEHFSQVHYCGKGVKVQSEFLERLPIEEQVLRASQSSVLISATGGGAFSLLFLPRWSTAILYTGTSNSTLDDMFFAHLGYVNVEYITSEQPLESVILPDVDKAIERYCTFQKTTQHIAL
jgi:hypothetical protein